MWYLKNAWYVIIILQTLTSSAHKNVFLIKGESGGSLARLYLLSSFL